MEHSIKIDRLFTLGDYKNVHVSIETTGISDEDWENQNKMDQIRTDVALEVLMNFSLLQELTSNNAENIANRSWTEIYQELCTDRHGPPFAQTDTEIISEL